MIKHYLKNGQQVDSVAGILIKQKDFPEVYRAIDNIMMNVPEDNEGVEHEHQCINTGRLSLCT